MKRIFIFILFYACLLGSGQAQEIHFSQIGANPLIINPANAGMFYEDTRVGLTTRNQWFNIANPAKTMSLYIDGRKYFEIPWRKRRNIVIPLDLTIGLSVCKFQGGAGNLNVTSVLPVFGLKYDILSIFTPKGRLSVSMATGLSLIDKNLEFNKLTFNDQWNPNEYVFDPSIQTGEPYHSKSYHNFATPVGICAMLFVPEESFAASAGISEFYQIIKNDDSFYDLHTHVDPICKFHAEVGVTLKKVPIHFYLLSMNQYFEDNKWYEIFNFSNIITMQNIIGFNVCVAVKDYDVIWGFGSRNNKFANYDDYNFRDVFISLGFSVKQLTVIGNYDLNVSRFHYGTNYQGALELTVKYTISSRTNIYKTSTPVYEVNKKPFSFPTATFD